MDKLARNTWFSLVFNMSYALLSAALGFWMRSWWFVTVGAYYAVLASARFCVLQVQRRAEGDAAKEAFAQRITGFLLMALSVCLCGMVTLAAMKDRGRRFHMIAMIAIAAYTFTRITLAIVRLVQARRSALPAEKTLRNISLADAFVSVYSLQRSMLVSFPGMAEGDIRLFNILTGTGVWLIVLLLGVNLIGGKRVNMAKSKIVQANEKIAETVVGGYKKIEKGVVEGFQKIEQGVVEGYTKMEDKFVENYLTREGETVEEAKARLKKGTAK